MDKYKSLYVVARTFARDIYDRKSVSSGGGTQNNASRAYSMRLVARDACGAILLAHLAKITCALPGPTHNELHANTARAVDPWAEWPQLRSHAGDGDNSVRVYRMEIFLREKPDSFSFIPLPPSLSFSERILRLSSSSLSARTLMTTAAYQ